MSPPTVPEPSVRRADAVRRDGASFRDPSGFVFEHQGEVLRQVNPVYANDYDRLLASGLYERLVGERLLLPHTEVEPRPETGVPAHRVLRPEQLAFVGYPYEWCFGQLRDAALLTLRVQAEAMQRGMSLKDASAYNAQLHGGRVVFIDTLSFERYVESEPWVAYRQFCQQFLAPLALVAHRDVRLAGLSRLFIDGVPLDLASELLPRRTRWSVGLGLHVHLHARSQAKHADSPAAVERARGRFTRRKLEALLHSLESAVRALSWRGGDSAWSDYYEANHNYGDAGLEAKERLVGELLDAVRPRTVWDLGANTGRFSRIAVRAGARTVVSWDLDPACVEANYRQVVRAQETAVVPLVADLTNPSPGLGWAGAERRSFADRGPADAVLALGLVHHLAIGNNVPLEEVAAYFARLARDLVVEWIPKQDSQVQRMLASRQDVFPRYDEAHFEQDFGRRFEIVRRVAEPGTARSLYLLRAR